MVPPPSPRAELLETTPRDGAWTERMRALDEHRRTEALRWPEHSLLPLPYPRDMAARPRNDRPDRETARAALESALTILRADPPRLKRLMRSVADLAGELADLADEAEQPQPAAKLRGAATKLRGAALLPASIAVALLRKSLGKLVDLAAE